MWFVHLLEKQISEYETNKQQRDKDYYIQNRLTKMLIEIVMSHFEVFCFDLML